MKLAEIVLIAALLSLAACSTSTNFHRISQEQASEEAENQRELILREQMKLAARLYEIGFRLATANYSLCGDKIDHQMGVMLQTTVSMEPNYARAASRLFGVGEHPTITYAAETSPAQLAGLQVGDQIISINGKTWSKPKKAMATIGKELRSSQGEAVVLGVSRGEEHMDISVTPVPVCGYPVTLQYDDVVNAYADGQRVIVTTGMMRLVDSDEELALVVGHEIAHNSQGHLAAKRGNALLGGLLGAVVSGVSGVNVTNSFAEAGAQAFSQDFESEADYVGVYMAARAGYDTANAADFWRRMSVLHPAAVDLQGSSHPSNSVRFVAIQKTSEEVAQKRAEGLELLPNPKEP